MAGDVAEGLEDAGLLDAPRGDLLLDHAGAIGGPVVGASGLVHTGRAIGRRALLRRRLTGTEAQGDSQASQSGHAQPG
jgi:hypothetical protein